MIRIGLVVVGLTGCVGLQPAYVAADRQTYEAVAPDYRRDVEADPELGPGQRERRARTLDSWRARIEQGEAASNE